MLAHAPSRWRHWQGEGALPTEHRNRQGEAPCLRSKTAIDGREARPKRLRHAPRRSAGKMPGRLCELPSVALPNIDGSQLGGLAQGPNRRKTPSKRPISREDFIRQIVYASKSSRVMPTNAKSTGVISKMTGVTFKIDRCHFGERQVSLLEMTGGAFARDRSLAGSAHPKTPL